MRGEMGRWNGDRHDLCFCFLQGRKGVCVIGREGGRRGEEGEGSKQASAGI